MGGDAPRPSKWRSRTRAFPPHGRGCTPIMHEACFPAFISPAWAGMHLSYVGMNELTAYFPPPMGGDAPLLATLLNVMSVFPPHGRGCTVSIWHLHLGISISPAWAGMHPGYWPKPQASKNFPRMGGDAPRIRDQKSGPNEFPPHGRGCTDTPNLE